MDNLIERLQAITCATTLFLHKREIIAALEAKDAEIERLTITADEQHITLRLLAKKNDNCRCADEVRCDRLAEIERLQARVETLEGNRKRDCVAFFQWWWNKPGSNTEQGYDAWVAATEREGE